MWRKRTSWRHLQLPVVDYDAAIAARSTRFTHRPHCRELDKGFQTPFQELAVFNLGFDSSLRVTNHDASIAGRLTRFTCRPHHHETKKRFRTPFQELVVFNLGFDSSLRGSEMKNCED
ncbi:hypothetical protein U1Q18_014291 [Sarracenia purpurea var. burkii]